jgi:hypothetical protein
MSVNKCVSGVEQAAIETGEVELEGLGATANNRESLANPDSGVHYNVFVDIWRWASRHFKRKHGDTHR